MRQFMTLALIASLTFSTSLAQIKKPKTAVAAPAIGNVEDLTAAQLKAYLTFIASDEMEGRDTPSKGLNITAKFIAAMLEHWGVQPAGENGTYFQKINLRRSKIEPEKTFAEINGQSFKYGDDFLVNAVPATISGNCVYVGHGYVIKSRNINAYQTPAGTIDVKDKIVIINSGFPKDVTMRELTGKQGEDWLDPATYARQNGAKAILAIPNFLTLANWKNAQRSVLQRGSLRPDMGNEAPPPLPALTLSVPMVNALFASERVTGLTVLNRGAAGEMVEPFDLNKKVSFTIGGVVEQIPTQNVVGVLPGSDPVLKNEYVAIGAHYDHVGIGAPDAKGDTIYNGADDDGSGTTAVLALAETFAKGPHPKRSLLFIWHCGEEKGLWGSEYFANHPTVDLKQIITQLNIDMIGRSKQAGDTNPRNRELSGPNEIYVIGSKMMSTELGALSERVNNGFLKLDFNYKYDDPKDPNRFFFRSDHFNYAHKGVPIIFYFDGEHEDYHRPSDHVEKIDFQKMEKVARTIYATAWELGNTPSRPKVDKQLPAELSGN